MWNHANAAMPDAAKSGACLCRFSLETVGLQHEGCRHAPARISADSEAFCTLARNLERFTYPCQTMKSRTTWWMGSAAWGEEVATGGGSRGWRNQDRRYNDRKNSRGCDS